MKLLSKAEYLATFVHPMQSVSTEGDSPVPFWGYYDTIPQTDFEEHARGSETVGGVWNNVSGGFQHILVNTEDKNVFMVIVLDLHQAAVYGHHLLDLNREYGLRGD